MLDEEIERCWVRMLRRSVDGEEEEKTSSSPRCSLEMAAGSTGSFLDESVALRDAVLPPDSSYSRPSTSKDSHPPKSVGGATSPLERMGRP
jgi:hypothetical protein